jgi:ribosomal protein RSM22 (predicted rRNA methylase)
MIPNLPPWLNVAIEFQLQNQRMQALSAASTHITQNYRNFKSSRHAITENIDVAAYLAARLPATYAAIAASLNHVLHRLPEFSPKTMLDIGAGPGTASFAACEQLQSLQYFTLIDDNTYFLNMCEKLILDAPINLQHAQIINANITKATEFPQSELIIAGYSMVELPLHMQLTLVKQLWQACSGILLIVEPGTPKAYSNLMLLRSQLIEAGAYVVAPCVGNYACPLETNDWCHFSQRLPRSRAHMQAKGANVPFEDEKFSYLAVSRTHIKSSEARILAPPQISKVGIEFKLCTKNGLEQLNIPSRDKPAYKHARKLDWGDMIL